MFSLQNQLFMQYTDQIKYFPGIGGSTGMQDATGLTAGTVGGVGPTSIKEEFMHTASKGFVVIEVKDTGVGIPRKSI